MVHPPGDEIQDGRVLLGLGLVGDGIDGKKRQFPLPVDRQGRSVGVQGPVCQVEHVIGLMLEIKL